MSRFFRGRIGTGNAGKVKEIRRTAASTKKNGIFDYDALGNQVAEYIYTNQARMHEKSTNHNGESGSTLNSTGVVSVLNAITGQTGTVHVVLKLFGGSHGSSGTFRMDNFTLNGYTQQVPSTGSSNSSAYVVSSGYRYGYQGSEMDNEVKGNGNSYTTFFRQLNPRLGRWLSIDPKVTAWGSPYVSMNNNPILFNDQLGDTIILQGAIGYTSEATETLYYVDGVVTNKYGGTYEVGGGFFKSRV